MHSHSSAHPHPLLAQLYLSVSPFINLPSAVTLPYNYQTLPHSLPASSTAPPPPPPGATSQVEPPPVGYITSPSGTFTTTPEAIISSCQNLITHLSDGRRAAEEKILEWERGIEKRELMEKRRVAPGYLDTGVMMLTPVRLRGKKEGEGEGEGEGGVGREAGGKEGEDLDRMFGGMM